MRSRHHKPLLCVAALTAACVALSGCGEAQPAPAKVVATPAATPLLPPVTPEPALIAASAEKASETPTAPSVSTEDAATALQAANSEPTPAAENADYQAPFPDRVELFVAPKRQGGSRSPGEKEDAVELLGFVRVNQPQVVLSINGEVTLVAEGATEHGVEVISIQPPTVVLQRGRQRLQETLQN